MENQNSQLSAYDRMRELHTWLDTWDRYVQRETRTRDTETSDVNEPTPPRKRVVIRKSNLS